VPRHVAAHLGMRRYEAPFVLEGGSFLVDGEGTLITTEQCLLNPNRNATMSRAQIEQGLRDYLGVDVIVWLGTGHSKDQWTDGHIDCIASYVAPGTVALLAPEDPNDPDHGPGCDNFQRLRGVKDARGRSLDVIRLQTRPLGAVAYLNIYLPNGGAIVPVADQPEDEQALEQIGRLFPDRELVPISGHWTRYGGGGPHCITQQLPIGIPVPE
jgi:agmatine deiminase